MNKQGDVISNNNEDECGGHWCNDIEAWTACIFTYDTTLGIQGETDSFGCEIYYQCKHCREEGKKTVVQKQTCVDCGIHNEDVHLRPNFDRDGSGEQLMCMDCTLGNHPYG